MTRVTVVGAGLAGCETAWQLVQRDLDVSLVEMKPDKKSPAHHSDAFCELVCSNSLRSDERTNAVGLLKEEMRRLGSLVIAAADATRVPAGGALAVDRSRFAQTVTDRILAHPRITVEHREQTVIPDGPVVIATGPLTEGAFAQALDALLGGSKPLSFFDAAAPIVALDGIDMDSAWLASRYGKGTADYLNCPLDEGQYKAFRQALAQAEEAQVHGFEDSGVFEGCMPIEVMARRGEDTMRYGPMKPVGLTDPKTGRVPYAVVQLRRDNDEGTMYNIVGFQTHLKFGEQQRVFSMIPALKNAEFLRYGVMHRNTYLDSPRLLDRYYRLISEPRIRFAGQMTGVEGYVESAASGLLAGIETARELEGLPPADFPKTTAIGALAAYISGGSIGNFQPMNINFGLIEPLPYRVKGKKNRYLALADRSLQTIDGREGEVADENHH